MDTTNLWCNILDVCPQKIPGFEGTMKPFKQFCRVDVCDTLVQDVVKDMLLGMHLWKIEVFNQCQFLIIL
jgi:hypothetical protein